MQRDRLLFGEVFEEFGHFFLQVGDGGVGVVEVHEYPMGVLDLRIGYQVLGIEYRILDLDVRTAWTTRHAA